MRAFVFTDRSLARHAGRFVWLSVNIDNTANSAFLVKFPVTGTPTLMVIDPKNETVALRYLGSATAPQLETLLRDGAGIVRGTRLAAADEAITRADRLATQKQPAEAAKAYEEAMRLPRSDGRDLGGRPRCSSPHCGIPAIMSAARRALSNSIPGSVEPRLELTSPRRDCYARSVSLTCRRSAPT